MSIQEIIEKIKPFYNVLGPHNFLYEWAKINHGLNKTYPLYNIEDDGYGTNIKNSSRHFAGGALGNQFYGEDITRKLGDLKETKDNIFEKDKIPDLDFDRSIDYLNNERGINYTKENPNVSRQEVYNAAIENAIKNYTNDYINKNVYGQLIQQ